MKSISKQNEKIKNAFGKNINIRNKMELCPILLKVGKDRARPGPIQISPEWDGMRILKMDLDLSHLVYRIVTQTRSGT